MRGVPRTRARAPHEHPTSTTCAHLGVPRTRRSSLLWRGVSFVGKLGRERGCGSRRPLNIRLFGGRNPAPVLHTPGVGGATCLFVAWRRAEEARRPSSSPQHPPKGRNPASVMPTTGVGGEEAATGLFVLGGNRSRPKHPMRVVAGNWFFHEATQPRAGSRLLYRSPFFLSFEVCVRRRCAPDARPRRVQAQRARRTPPKGALQTHCVDVN